MKTALCLVLAVFVCVEVDAGEKCQPGEVKKKDCNWCWCGNYGGWTCTLMGCQLVHPGIEYPPAERVHSGIEYPPAERVLSDIEYPHPHPHPAIREKICQEDETKMVECNRCWCTRDQTGWICTKMGCVSADKVESAAEHQLVKREKICQEDETKMVECNRCWCTRDQMGWVCTRMACFSDKVESAAEHQLVKRDSPISEDLRDVPCAPNDFFKLDCNTCYCNLERTGFLCTENTCKEEVIPSYQSTTSIPLRKGTRLLIFNERHEILRRVEAKDGKPTKDDLTMDNIKVNVSLSETNSTPNEPTNFSNYNFSQKDSNTEDKTNYSINETISSLQNRKNFHVSENFFVGEIGPTETGPRQIKIEIPNETVVNTDPTPITSLYTSTLEDVEVSTTVTLLEDIVMLKPKTGNLTLVLEVGETVQNTSDTSLSGREELSEIQ